MGIDPVTLTLALSATGLATSVGGKVLEAQATSEASDASKRAEAARLRQAQLEEAQRRRQVLRQAIIARSTSLSTATAQGAADSSAFAGVASSYGTQLAGNVGNINQSAAIRDDIFAANSDYADASAAARNYGAVGDLGKDIFASSEKLGKLFGSP